MLTAHSDNTYFDINKYCDFKKARGIVNYNQQIYVDKHLNDRIIRRTITGEIFKIEHIALLWHVGFYKTILAVDHIGSSIPIVYQNINSSATRVIHEAELFPLIWEIAGENN